MLKAKNYISRIKTYKAGEKIEGGIKLSSNENPYGCSKNVLYAIKDIGALSIYHDGSAYKLRRVIADYLNNRLALLGYSPFLTPDFIITGNGSGEVIENAIKTYLRPGNYVVSPKRGFILYRIQTYANGGLYRESRLKRDFSIDINNLIKLAKEKKTDIVVMANPNNPTGSIVRDSDIQNVISSIGGRKLLIIDEAYAEYAGGDFISAIPYTLHNKNIIITRTFSKVYGLASLRIGYGIAHPDLIENINKIRLPFNTSLVSQIAAIESLKDVEFVLKSIDKNNKQKVYLYREFDKLGIEYIKSYTNFIFVKAIKSLDKRLADYGISIRSLTSFGFLDGHYRITIGTQQQNKLLVKALKQIYGDIK